MRFIRLPNGNLLIPVELDDPAEGFGMREVGPDHPDNAGWPVRRKAKTPRREVAQEHSCERPRWGYNLAYRIMTAPEAGIPRKQRGDGRERAPGWCRAA
jgi:hypothetical protein